MSGAKFGLEPGEVSVSFPVAALLDTRSRARSASLLFSPLLPQTHKASALPTQRLFGEDVRGQGRTSRSPLSLRIPALAIPTGLSSNLAAGNAEEPNGKNNFILCERLGCASQAAANLSKSLLLSCKLLRRWPWSRPCRWWGARWLRDAGAAFLGGGWARGCGGVLRRAGGTGKGAQACSLHRTGQHLPGLALMLFCRCWWLDMTDG